MKLYFDSSALVPAFVREDTSKRAMQLLLTATTVHASELTITETRIAFQRKRKRGAISHAEYGKAINSLDKAIEEETLLVTPLPVAAFRSAETIGERTIVPIRAMDALHIAMAARLGAELATFDDDQATVACSEGITVHTEIP